MALPMTDTMHLPALPPSHSNSTKSSSSVTGSSGRSSSHSVLDSVLNIEEFLAANPLPTIAEKGSSKKKQKLNDAKTDDEDLVPKALSSRSSESIVLLHTKIQLYALGRPDFTFNHVLHSTAGDGWSVRLRLAGPEEEIDLEEGGPFASKQEAKEAVCAKALEVLKEWEADGKVGKAETGKKRKGMDVEMNGEVLGEKEKEAFVNWTGLLLEFQRSNSAPQPTYTDYTLGTRFSCTCSLDNVPGRTFGSPTDLFAGKKAARQNASRLAVEYFKEVGEWPENAGLDGLQGIRKKKGKKAGGVENSSSSSGEEEKEGPSDDRRINDTSPSPSDSEENRLTSTSKGKGKAESEPDAGPAGTTTTPVGSYASLAASLARALNLGTPQYHFHPSSTLSSDFHTVSCTFPQAGERRFREEPVGFVRHVHGKKKAKQECARVVVGLLEEVRRERRAALERGVELDVEMEVRKEGDEGEDVFEDAVEVMSGDGK